MLRGRRLPSLQSPLSRWWRITAPGPGRTTATTSFSSKTVSQPSDDGYDGRSTAPVEMQHEEKIQGVEQRLCIRKIAVYGDDWALLHGRRVVQPTTQHAQLSVQGKTPFGNRISADMQKAAEKVNRLHRSRAPARRDVPQEVEFRMLWHPQGVPRKFDAKRHPAPQASRYQSVPRTGNQEAGPTLSTVQKAKPPEQLSQTVSRSADNKAQFLTDNLHKTIAHVRESPASDRPLSKPGQPQRELAHKVGLKPWTEMPHRAQEAITHQRKSMAFEKEPLVRARASSVPMAASLQVPHQVGLLDAGQHADEAPRTQADTGSAESTQKPLSESLVFTGAEPLEGQRIEPWRLDDPHSSWSRVLKLLKPLDDGQNAGEYCAAPRDIDPESEQLMDEPFVAAGGIGPAESIRRSFANDPVLKQAKLLSTSHSSPPVHEQPLSRLDTYTEPRFRLVPSWKPIPGHVPKSLGPSKHTSLFSKGDKKGLNKKGETQPQQGPHYESLGDASGLESSKPTATDLRLSTAADDIELETPKDRPHVGDAGTPYPTPKAQEAQASEVEGHGAGDKGTELREPAQSIDSRSIFEKLFAEHEQTKGPDYGQLATKPKSDLSGARKEQSNQTHGHHAKEMSPRQGLSIYGQLFPEQLESEEINDEPEVPGAAEDSRLPPESSVMVSLRNEIRKWMLGEGQQLPIGPEPGEYGSHSTVVVISGTSASLIDTDFYRIAPEGQHVEGWVGGLVKVIQAHDPISYAPLGQYYLMFHSRPSALAYADKVQRLHSLSRKLLHAPADSGREVAKGSLDQAPTTPQPFLTDEERAAVRSFTLCSPKSKLNISVRMWNTQLVEELAAKSNIADVLTNQPPAVSIPARVLLKLTPTEGHPGEAEGGLTTDELWLTLRDDGRERSAPWVLANLSEGIMPVRPKFISEHYKVTVKAETLRVPLELDDEDFLDEDAGEPVVGPLPPKSGAAGNNGDVAGGVDRNKRFNRFVLTFAQPAIARRFVRCWHKRVVHDAMLGRSVVVDAAAIM